MSGKSLFLLTALVIFSADVSAQVFPDTIWIPVTYYDFHSDQSNPEFECDHKGRVRHNMVADYLDADTLPVPGSNPYINHYIKYWYRDWRDSARGDFTIPKYRKISGGTFNAVIAYDGPVTVGYDTAFKNVVIHDSLPFEHIGNGVYDFRDDSFFPLDGIGFGNEGKYHNFAFTMKLHTTFVMKPGLTFNFRGDDDVWAFIDNRLAMDLGGIHSASNGSFQTDTISGLVQGQEYSFSLFFAERHTTESHIWITTNIVSTHIVNEVTIVAEPPNATIPAGDSVVYTGTVWYDSVGQDGIVHHLPDSQLSQQITWSYVSDNPSSNPAGTSLLPATGAQSIFTSTEAFETFTVTASYEDPVTHQITSAQMTITIVAGPPNHLVVEASWDTSLSIDIKQNDQPLDTLVIGAAAANGRVYAMLRDQYGNFVNHSIHTGWTILTGTIIASATNGIQSRGEGVVTKHGPSGIGRVSATDLDYSGPTYTDDVMVKVLNEAPVANNDIYTVAEDHTLTVPSSGKPSVLNNDTDPDPNAVLTVELVANVSVGVLNFNSDGSFTYVPPSNYNGNAVFTYKAYDGELYSNIATVTIIVGADNDPPTASDDSYSALEDNALNIAAPGVLSNDNDIDGDPLSASLIQDVDPSAGTLTLNADGSFLYTPAPNYNGIVTFTYQAFDGTVNSNVATVTITVAPANDTPAAVNDNYIVNEDNTLNIAAFGVLTNDIDPDGDALSATLVTNVSSGTLALNANGSFSYTPNLNFTGTDSFTYKASDGTARSNVSTVTITVTAINDVPTAVNDNYTIGEDNMLTVAAAGVLTNDIDVEGNPLTAVLVNGINPSQGILTLHGNGSLTYTPTPNFVGTATFNYQAFDGKGYSNTATVMIFVSGTNDAPVANNDIYMTDEDVKLNVTSAEGVLANDIDIDGDVLSASMVSGITPTEGTLVFNSDGSFTYTPALNYTGNFTFTYTAHDDSSISNTATVTVWVGESNEPPTAVNDSYTTGEDTPLTIDAPGILTNDSDPDHDPLTTVLVQDIDASKGNLELNENGSFTFTPTLNFSGGATFTYQANDGRLNSNIATVTITVLSGNDAPTANNDNYTTDEDVILHVPTTGIPGLLSNDSDPDGDPMNAILATDVDPTKGALALNSGGSFTFTPALHFNGTASFTYKAFDGTAYSNIATVTITVNAKNDAPVISTIPDQTINKGGSFQSINLNDYVTDPDNTDAEITWSTSGSTHVTIAVDPVTHVATVTILDTMWTGSETITFSATDPEGLYDTEPVIFTVNKLPRLPMPETDTIPGTYFGNGLTVNLYVPGYTQADILYTGTTDGTTPPDPKTGSPLTINGSGTVSFGPFVSDSTPVKVCACATRYPYEDSENRLFEYLVVYPALPDPVAQPGAGQYDTTNLCVTLSIPGHPDADIYYTLDGSDPATSATRIHYNTTGTIVLGPYTQVNYKTLKVYAIKTYYKPSSAAFEYSFNPSGLPKPVADPPGHTFHTDSIKVRLYVPGEPDAEIRFTVDGTMPNVNSDLYTDRITINKNTTLKAVAVKNGYLPGPVMTENYIQSLPASLKLYPDVATTTPYPPATACNAGMLFPLVAKIFDQYDTCLTQYLTNDAPISWKIQEITGSNTGTLSVDSGYATSFLPIKAHHTVKIIATFSEYGRTFSGEITLIINPGEPYKLWLEADYDRHVSPNAPNPVDTIRLSNSKTTEEVYAVVRDSLGNWAATSKSTAWLSAAGSIASVISGKPDLGEGILTKGTTDGCVVVTGENTNLSLACPCDSTVVAVMSYWYDSLRIVVNNAVASPVDSLVMNTNQDSILYVFGHRDDGVTPAWEEVSAKWELVDKSLEYIIAAPPASAHKYTLSPVDTATGRIRVTFGDDSVTVPDTALVRFIPGGPMRVEFELLTPDSLCIAGDTLTTVVRLYNGDNKLVYGTWKYPGDGLDSAAYDDVIGKADRPAPFFVVDGARYTLYDQGSFAAQTFYNGIDTVDFVLYYAPYDEDSLHLLTVTLDYAIKASTRPFRLLAAKLDEIDIVVDNTTPDTLYIYYNSGKMLKVIGYDTFGNIIEVVICNWETGSDIPSILYPDSTKQVYYTVGNITYTTSGFITATSILDSTIQDSVLLIIGPRPANLVTALTQDISGNGYLDGIKLFFDKKIIFPANTLSDDLLSLYHIINGDKVDIYIDSLVQAGDTAGPDSVFMAYFAEYNSGDVPQTDWLPYVTITGIPDIADVSGQLCADGAPAVVWSVLKTANTSGNTSKDRIAVTLSEQIKNTDGSSFMYAGISPAAIFNVWHKSDNGFVLIPDMLTGIHHFFDHTCDTLFFYMTNGNNINSNHYVNLVFQDSLLADGAYNTPALNNQKVPVQVVGTIDKIVIGPNPVIPTLAIHNKLKDQPLTHVDPYIVYNMIKSNGGAMIVADIELSTDDLSNSNLRITGQLMIFDAVGNLVFAKENRNNVLPDDWQIPDINQIKESGTLQLIFYWDGVTDRDRKACPGIYRVALTVQYGKNTRKVTGTLAVGR